MGRNLRYVAVAVIVLLVGLLIWVSAGDEPTPDATSSPTIAASDISTIAYARGRTLLVHDVDSDSDSTIARLPSDEIAVDTAATIFAVTANPPPADAPSDAAEHSRILVGELAEGAKPKAVGSGHAPVFSPDGGFVAAIAYAFGYEICSPDCITTERVEAYRTSGRDKGPTTVLGADHWRVVGWSEDRVMGVSGLTSGVVLGRRGNEMKEIEIIQVTPEVLWGVSPVAPVMLTVNADGGNLLSTDGSSDPVHIPLDADRLADGAWSPDGRWIAAVSEADAPEVILIDTEAKSSTTVGDSSGAVGGPLWTTDSAVVWDASSEHFAFVRTTDGSYEVVVCSPTTRCTTELTSDDPIELKAIS
jgi:hypothetical protein